MVCDKLSYMCWFGQKQEFTSETACPLKNFKSDLIEPKRKVPWFEWGQSLADMVSTTL